MRNHKISLNELLVGVIGWLVLKEAERLSDTDICIPYALLEGNIIKASESNDSDVTKTLATYRKLSVKHEAFSDGVMISGDIRWQRYIGYSYSLLEDLQLIITCPKYVSMTSSGFQLMRRPNKNEAEFIDLLALAEQNRRRIP